MEKWKSEGSPQRDGGAVSLHRAGTGFMKEDGYQQAWRTWTGKVIGKEETSDKMRTNAQN